jgi:hypothetical protein
LKTSARMMNCASATMYVTVFSGDCAPQHATAHAGCGPAWPRSTRTPAAPAPRASPCARPRRRPVPAPACCARLHRHTPPHAQAPCTTHAGRRRKGPSLGPRVWSRQLSHSPSTQWFRNVSILVSLDVWPPVPLQSHGTLA